MEGPKRTELNVKEVFQELSETFSRHGYRPQPQDMVAVRECMLELAKWPAIELTAGGIGGWLLGSVLGRRLPAACIGMFICYGQVDRRPAEEFCLHQIMALPTPLGAEATAIVRERDANSPLLRYLSTLHANTGRITKSSQPSSSDQPKLSQQAPTTQEVPKQYPYSNADAVSGQDDPIWQTSDPFDLCSSDTPSQWPTSAAQDPKLLAVERRRKRQEAYRLRKEARKQQHQGELLSDLDHDDIFRESPR